MDSNNIVQPQRSAIRIFDRDIVFFDTETTGLAASAEIIEIGFVKAKARTFEIVAEGDIKMHIDYPEKADPDSLAIVGYSAEEWKQDAVDRRTGITEFLKHCDGAMLAGHNLPFDRMHLENEMEALGLQMPFFYKGLDTFVMAWSLLGDQPEFTKFSLGELANHFLIDQGRAHRAIDDARTTYKVFLELMKISEHARRV
jgi:DNA polymerase-3 subunit epsilon